jgi:anti-anti-sigma factor
VSQFLEQRRQSVIGHASDNNDPAATGAGQPISWKVEDEQLVIALEGEIDAAQAESLPAAICSIPHRGTSVLIDVAAVTFVDSAFLRALLQCQGKLGADGVILKVCNPSDQARRVFATTGMTHLLQHPMGVDVKVEFDDLSEHQRNMVARHPLATDELYRHGGLPVRWVATFACPPTCHPDRLYEAIEEWATFYGLPLRRRLLDAA